MTPLEKWQRDYKIELALRQRLLPSAHDQCLCGLDDLSDVKTVVRPQIILCPGCRASVAKRLRNHKEPTNGKENSASG